MSKPAPVPPHRFPDFYFFLAPGLLVLACPSLAGRPASFSILRVAKGKGASALPPPPLPGAFAGGGCLHRSDWPNRVPTRLGWAAPGTLSLQITSGKLSQALP